MPKIITTSLSEKLVKWIEQTATFEKVHKKTIIEKALQNYQEEYKKKQLTKMFQEASKDKDIVGMAEENMSDYFNQIKIFS